MTLLDDLTLMLGTWRDYAALAAHHYRGHRPVTGTRILALRRAAPTVVGRFLRRRGETQTVGVLVESLPALACRMRDVALGDRYRGLRGMRQRAVVLNRELRCISRVIVHPQWRGLGLAVRLVSAALADPATIYTEALAAMGKVHPFFAQAGMTRYERPPHPFDARLRDALLAAGIDPLTLALPRDVAERIGALALPQRRWLEKELRRWARVRDPALRRAAALPEVLRAAQRCLFCEPVYFLRDNRAFLEGS